MAFSSATEYGGGLEAGEEELIPDMAVSSRGRCSEGDVLDHNGGSRREPGERQSEVSAQH